MKAAELDQLDEKAADAIEKGVQRGMAAPRPSLEELYSDVYCTY